MKEDFEAYEKLFALIGNGDSIASRIIENDLSFAEREELISSAIFPIVKHLDESALYIDEEIAVHCGALFMGVEDIADLETH